MNSCYRREAEEATLREEDLSGFGNWNFRYTCDRTVLVSI